MMSVIYDMILYNTKYDLMMNTLEKIQTLEEFNLFRYEIIIFIFMC